MEHRPLTPIRITDNIPSTSSTSPYRPTQLSNQGCSNDDVVSETESTAAETASTCSSFDEWSSGSDSDSNPNRIFYGPTRTPERKLLQKVRHKDSREFHRRKTLWEDPSLQEGNHPVLSFPEIGRHELPIVSSGQSPCSTPPPRSSRRSSCQTYLESAGKHMNDPARLLSTPPASPPADSTSAPSPSTRSLVFPPSPSGLSACGSPVSTFITSRARTIHHTRRKPSHLMKADESFSTEDGSDAANSEDEPGDEPKRELEPELEGQADVRVDEEPEEDWETEEEEEEGVVVQVFDLASENVNQDASEEEAKDQLEGEITLVYPIEESVLRENPDAFIGEASETISEAIVAASSEIVTLDTAEKHLEETTDDTTTGETHSVIASQVAPAIIEEAVEEPAEISTKSSAEDDSEDSTEEASDVTLVDPVEEPVEEPTSEVIIESNQERTEVTSSDVPHVKDSDSADETGDASGPDVGTNAQGEGSGEDLVAEESVDMNELEDDEKNGEVTESQKGDNNVGDLEGVADVESVAKTEQVEHGANGSQVLDGQDVKKMPEPTSPNNKENLFLLDEGRTSHSSQSRLEISTIREVEEESAALPNGISSKPLHHQTLTSGPRVLPSLSASCITTSSNPVASDKITAGEQIQSVTKDALVHTPVISVLDPIIVSTEPTSKPMRSTPKRAQKSSTKNVSSNLKSSRLLSSSLSPSAFAPSRRALSKPDEFAMNRPELTKSQGSTTPLGPLRQTFPNPVEPTSSSDSVSVPITASTFKSKVLTSVSNPLSLSLPPPSATDTLSSSPIGPSSRLQIPSRTFGSNVDSKVPKREINASERLGLSKSAFRPTLSSKPRGFISGVSMRSRGGYSSPSKSTTLGPPVRVIHSPSNRPSSSTTALYGSHSLGPLSRSVGSVSPAPGSDLAVLPRVRPFGVTNSRTGSVAFGHGSQKDTLSETLPVDSTRKAPDQGGKEDSPAKIAVGSGSGTGDSVRSISPSLIPISASTLVSSSLSTSAPFSVSPSTTTAGQDRPARPAGSLRSIPTRRSARAAGEPIGRVVPTSIMPPISRRSRTGHGGSGVSTSNISGLVHPIVPSTNPSLTVKSRKLPQATSSSAAVSSSSAASLPAPSAPSPSVPQPSPLSMPTPPIVTASVTATSAVPAPPPMLSKELASLTDHNTIVNGVLFCALTRTVVRREGEHRPSSPGPQKKTPSATAVSGSMSSAGSRRGKKALFDSGSEGDEDEEDDGWLGLNGEGSRRDLETESHSLGPGEDEVFVSPIRRDRLSASSGRKQLWSASTSTSAVDGGRSSEKVVKWKKSLVVSNNRYRAGRMDDPTEGMTSSRKKSCIKPTTSLDIHGNLDLTKLPPLTSFIKRTKVTYVRFVYDDDLPKVPVGEKKKKRGK